MYKSMKRYLPIIVSVFLATVLALTGCSAVKPEVREIHRSGELKIAELKDGSFDAISVRSKLVELGLDYAFAWGLDGDTASAMAESERISVFSSVGDESGVDMWVTVCENGQNVRYSVDILFRSMPDECSRDLISITTEAPFSKDGDSFKGWVLSGQTNKELVFNEDLFVYFGNGNCSIAFVYDLGEVTRNMGDGELRIHVEYEGRYMYPGVAVNYNTGVCYDHSLTAYDGYTVIGSNEIGFCYLINKGSEMKVQRHHAIFMKTVYRPEK